MTINTFSEDLKPVEGLVPQIGAAGVLTSDYVSVKNLHKLYAIIHYNQGDATDMTWRVMRATAVAPTGAVVIANAVEIWSNLDCVTSDLLVRRAAAINYASGVGLTHKLIIFEIDPSTLGQTALGVDYDCVAVGSTGAIAATSTVSILLIGVPRYPAPAAMQPSIIID